MGRPGRLPSPSHTGGVVIASTIAIILLATAIPVVAAAITDIIHGGWTAHEERTQGDQ